MQPNRRNISLDFYRILCMFLITTTHFVGYSNLIKAIPPNHVNSYIVLVLQMMQKIAINGFTLISAYFLVATEKTAKKVISFWLQLLFTSICILLISAVFDLPTLSISTVVKSVFPVLSNHYWYPVNYLILLLCVPFLNKVILSFSKMEFQRFLVLLVGIVTVFFHINPFFNAEIYIGHYSHSILWFFTLYFVGAYLRLYGIKASRLVVGCVFLISGILLLGSIAIENNMLYNITSRFPIIKTVLGRMQLTSNNSILVLLLTACSFILAERAKCHSITAVSALFAYLAPTVFGIYLIQEHNAVRQPLWDMLRVEQWATSYWLFAIMIGVFACLWACSILLYLFYKFIHRLFVGKLEAWLLGCCEKIKSIIVKRLS